MKSYHNTFPSVLFGFLLVQFTAFSRLANAENGAPLQAIYTVSMQQVIEQSILGKAARNDLQEELKKREVQLNARKAEIQKSKDELSKQRSVLAAAAFSDREQSIERKERDLNQDFQAQREEIGRRTDAQMKKLLTQVDEVLKELSQGKDRSVVMEMDPRFVVYADPKLDITADVIKRLNEKKLSL